MYKRGIVADVIFVDPPRKGLYEITIKTIQKIKPKKLVYISCNPATLMRDLKVFEKDYTIEIEYDSKAPKRRSI